MNKIKILPENIANQIAAGEVIVRPASCVKELVENSIDAGAKNIKVNIKKAGKKLIEVTDDGSGMTHNDAKIAFLRHATSKIREINDLNNIITFGFRGEALAAIASVSRIELLTREESESEGIYLYLESGKIKKEENIALNTGTIIKVKDLFFNTPARLKFLKSDYTEENHIIETVTLLGLSNEGISFSLKIDEKDVIFFPAQSKLKERIKIIYGQQIYNALLEIKNFSDNIKVYGYIVKPEITKTMRNFMNIFVNQRPVAARNLFYAIYEGYGTAIMKGTYPIAFIFIDINPQLIDVNVHPAKAEIKFKDEREVFNKIKYAISDALKSSELTPGINIEKKDRKETIQNAIKEYFVNETAELFTDKKGIFEKKVKEKVVVSQKRKFFNYRILGQLHKTYIIGEDEENLIIIDQHAAHEKLLYEEFLMEVESKKVKIQEMLIPEIIELTPVEKNILENNKELFKEMGFYLEPFGEYQYKITAHPVIIKDKMDKKMIKEIIEKIKEKEKTEKKEILKDLIATTACRAAFKAGDILREEEIENLISNYFEIEEPFSCPHGRPPVIKISFSEIEKMFKRKK